MQNPFKTEQAKDVALLLARVPLGVYFLLAGYAKIAGGVGNFVTKASPSIPHFLSPSLGRMYLQTLPFVEMIAGVAMVIGLYTRVSAGLIALMLISFAIAVTGVGFKAGEAPEIDKGLVFLGLALLLLTTGGGRMAVDQSFGKAAPGPGKK